MKRFATSKCTFLTFVALGVAFLFPTETKAISPVSDTFESGIQGWVVTGGQSTILSTSTVAQAGIKSGFVNQNTRGRVQKTGIPLNSGAVVIYWRANIQNSPLALIQVCEGGDISQFCSGGGSSAITRGTSVGGFQPNVWNSVLIAWRNNGNIKQFCVLDNNQDLINCTWTNSALPSSQSYDTVAIGSQNILGAGQFIYFDTIGSNTAPINWDAISGVSANINFDAIQLNATSSSLFSNQEGAATLTDLANRCTANEGNDSYFARGLCLAGAFLFIPNPATLNNFFNLPYKAQERFPFSWAFEIKDKFEGLSASTSTMVTLEYKLHDLGIGSTTPMGNIMPNITIFSKDTILEYIGQTTWNIFQTFLAAMLWLGFILHIYHSIQSMVKHQNV